MSGDELWKKFFELKFASAVQHHESGCKCGILVKEFLGFTDEEFHAYLEKGEISDRLKRVWQSNFDGFKARGGVL